MRKIREIKELTGIRFFAAFHVLFYHNFYLSGTMMDSTPNFIKNIFYFGDSAVSFFFILSGFILTYVYLGADQKLKTTKFDFGWARFSRLYPVYILALIMDLPRGINYFFNQYDFNTALTKVGITLFAYVGMFQSWHPRLTPAWNSPAWSLSVETFFYITFPLLISFIFKIKSSFRMIILVYLIPIILFTILKWGIDFDFDNAANAVFWRSFPLIRVCEFIVGILIGKIFIENNHLVNWFRENLRWSSCLFWLSLILSLIIVSIGIEAPRELIMITLLVPCFSVMIFTLSCGNISGTKIFRNQLLVLLGNASFTLYIIHQPVMYYFSLLELDKSPQYFISYAITTVALSVLIYKYFEIPLQKMIRKINPRHKLKV